MEKRKADLRKKVDARFAKFLKDQAGWKCRTCKRGFVPGSLELHASHFIGRRNIAVRFDPDNVDVQCADCHRRVTEKPLLHARWKRKQLGQERLLALVRRSFILRRFSDELAAAVDAYIEANTNQSEWSKDQEEALEEEPF